MSALAWASSVPLAMATETWAAASTGASLTPSPTMATTAPFGEGVEFEVGMQFHAQSQDGHRGVRHRHRGCARSGGNQDIFEKCACILCTVLYNAC